MRISDWSSDVCSSDLLAAGMAGEQVGGYALDRMRLGRALPVMTVLCAVGTLPLAGVPPLDAGWTKEARPEERRVGNEVGSTIDFRLQPLPQKKKKTQKLDVYIRHSREYKDTPK